MQLSAKYKKILYMRFRATLNFRIFFLFAGTIIIPLTLPIGALLAAFCRGSGTAVFDKLGA